MNQSNAKDYLPLVKALAEGETIQFNYPSGGWMDLAHISFDDPAPCYRIKQAPREFWVNTIHTAFSYQPCGEAFSTKEAAESGQDSMIKYKLIHAREVL